MLPLTLGTKQTTLSPSPSNPFEKVTQNTDDCTGPDGGIRLSETRRARTGRAASGFLKRRDQGRPVASL